MPQASRVAYAALALADASLAATGRAGSVQRFADVPLPAHGGLVMVS